MSRIRILLLSYNAKKDRRYNFEAYVCQYVYVCLWLQTLQRVIRPKSGFDRLKKHFFEEVLSIA